MKSKDMRWYKQDETDKIWWLESDNIGEFIFSFDKSEIFNLFRDYPHKLTQEQLEIFDRENPRWAEYFADRRRNNGRHNFSKS